MDNFLNLFAFASGCSVITIAFVYFSENKKKADLFVSFAICFFWGLDTLLLLSNDIAFYTHYPHLLYISEPFELFFGPLIYYRFRILIEGKMKFSLLTVFLFLPGVLAVIFFIPFYMLDPLEKLAYLGFHNIQNGLIRNIYLVIVNGQTPWFLLCTVLFIIHGSRMLSVKGIRLMMQRKVLVAYNLVWIAIALTGYSLMLLDKALMVKVMIIITNGMIIIFYFLEKKYAGFFLLMQEDASETKYRKSRLKGIDTGTTVERIRELMEIEQIYRDDVMSLQKLSAILQITPHQLSEILNNEMKMNFKTLINSYRIEAAKKKLAQKNDSTILELAFECGFSSKSVFNRTFSKIVGITPTEFRTKYKETGLSLYTGTTRPE